MQKLKSSFRPSRHWGPRDPITHHYWLSRREEGGRRTNMPRTSFRPQELGQLSGISSSLSITSKTRTQKKMKNAIRSNSDDLLIMIRRNFVAEINQASLESRKRSKSLDWDEISRMKLRNKLNSLLDSLTSGNSVSLDQEKNNNIVKVGLE